MKNDLVLSRVEAMLDDLEQLDADSFQQFRQPGDREASQIVARIERKMLANQEKATCTG